MASRSRLSQVSPNASIDNYRIYVPFCPKNSSSGNSSPFIDCYTPSSNSWKRATSIPRCDDNMVLRDFATVSLDRYIYVLGGRLGYEAAKENAIEDCDDRNGLSKPVVVAYVKRYDVVMDMWDTCAPMIQPRFNFACTVCNGKIYVAGGQSTLGRAQGISSCEVYDPALDQWRSLPNLSTMRYKCVAVTWKNRVVVLGGFVDGQGPFVMTRSSAEIYDSDQNKWCFLHRMWDLDVPPYQIVAVNGRLFSSGDCLVHWKGHIESYDEKLNMWNIVQGSDSTCLSPCNNYDNSIQEETRLYLTMAPIGNQLYFLAGYMVAGDGRQRAKVHVFDTAAHGQGWRSLEALEEDDGEKELCGHCCVVKQP